MSVLLVPWDPDSPEHVQRMRNQRVACGWKHDRVEKWRDHHRDGRIAFYWVVIAPSHPSRDEILLAATQKAPLESGLLEDSCTSVLSQVRDASRTSFQPIGHICLDGCAENHANDKLMISPRDGIYTIAALYILEYLQGYGFGGGAFTALEKIAAQEAGAKVITLDTMSDKDCSIDSPRMIALKRPAPKIPSLVSWYQRRGYTIYDQLEGAAIDVDSEGKIWAADLLYMKKVL